MTVYPHEAVVFPSLGALGQDRHRRKDLSLNVAIEFRDKRLYVKPGQIR